VIRTEHFLCCDRCEVEWRDPGGYGTDPALSPAEALPALRRSAATAGWTRVGERDLCPRCTTETT
jgi:hypothetical protein